MRELVIDKSAVAIWGSSTYAMTLSANDSRLRAKITSSRLRGLEIVCNNNPPDLRMNTFERMSGDAWDDGSGLRANAGCKGIDARQNFWETDADGGSRIHDGMDAEGLPIADVSDRLPGPADGTPTLPPSFATTYIQIRAYATGLTAWWDTGSSGGLPITYTVQALPEGVWEPERTIETTSPSVQFRHLDTSKRYRIRVISHNAAGTGWQLDTQAIYPVETANAPSAPTIELSRYRRTVDLSWSAADGGDPIRYFQWALSGPAGVIDGSRRARVLEAVLGPEVRLPLRLRGVRGEQYRRRRKIEP